ncbi:uncharacterized protein E0L32_006200 [Thyridium curvatum]|uniref:NACHT domain-containing protein n=1 Tax=Thyridium curvatum TaxID=1093900 RepID=A0A507BA32_9PEZI|nr:uncharacterized protein E0L32_006200 [Thyridium curvatum]TPX13470.1 hypothetical protein E0L32_006200 [Thyridium curvatum]
MRLLHLDADTGAIVLTGDLHKSIPRYAILSHRWGPEEVTFQELNDGTGLSKSGYKKIRFCCQQAQSDGIAHFWVDTCCIDKKDAVELREAINSMFRWYQDAARCYVYLDDVSSSPLHSTETCSEPPVKKQRRGSTTTTAGLIQSAEVPWQESLRESLWFKRGWTLQELIAPVSVEFFSAEGTRLGDKHSLEQLIHDVTRIPLPALKNCQLSDFSIDQRLSWMENRETSREEDLAYALLGILGVRMQLDYGEGRTSAFNRLRKKVDKLNSDPRDQLCLRDLRITDPRDDKKRIEQMKGGLLMESYHWVLGNEDFEQWRSESGGQILWIRGDPGKGKTMLLCGIINELSHSIELTGSRDELLAYFFCQATDERINNATAVLRGLVYMLVEQQPILVSHVRRKYDSAGKQLFEDVNAWTALTEILSSILKDPNLPNTILGTDALDECGTPGCKDHGDTAQLQISGQRHEQSTDLSRLIEFITNHSKLSRVKWVISSRNWPEIEEHLLAATGKVSLSLELNSQSISKAVTAYISDRVERLADLKRYGDELRCTVRDYFQSHAQDTFLWVALVCQDLAATSKRNTLSRLRAIPSGLNGLYQRMIDQIVASEDAELCCHILAIVSATKRPITIDELGALYDFPPDSRDDDSLAEVIGLCASFLTLRERTIFFVHQSAKDFLLQDARDIIFPSGVTEVHSSILANSLKALSRTLHRDMYTVGAPGLPIEKIYTPDPDPLVAVRYSCVHWIDHLDDGGNKRLNKVFQHHGIIHDFFKKTYLYWLEALSLVGSMESGVLSMAKIERLALEHEPQPARLVEDARRFFQTFKNIIKTHPLQTYASGLIFSPFQSLTRQNFVKEAPQWVTNQPLVPQRWSACLITLEGHRENIVAIAWSSDAAWLASASCDGEIRLWDSTTGGCQIVLEGHGRSLHYYYQLIIAFSSDGSQLAAVYQDNTIKIWDVMAGNRETALKVDTTGARALIWSSDGTQLALGYANGAVRLWDRLTGQCKKSLGLSTANSDEHISYTTGHIAWASNGVQLASISAYKHCNIQIWDMKTGRCERILENPESVSSVAWSRDCSRIALGCYFGTVNVWDPSTGQCKITLSHGIGPRVRSIVWSSDGTRLASASLGVPVKIWSTVGGRCEMLLGGYSSGTQSVVWSSDGARLASVRDGDITVWAASASQDDDRLETQNGCASLDRCLDQSPSRDALQSDKFEMASHESPAEEDSFNITSPIRSITWSSNNTQLATLSGYKTVQIWDATTGKCQAVFKSHEDLAMPFAWSSDSKHLKSCSVNGNIKIWNLDTGRCKETVLDHNRALRTVSWSNDGTRLASGEGWGKIWDLSTGQCEKTRYGDEEFTRLSWSADSTRLALSFYNTIGVWDSRTAKCTMILEHTGWVTSLAWSSDGARLASASDGGIKIWDLSTRRCLARFEGLLTYCEFLQFDNDVTQRLHTAAGTIDLGSCAMLGEQRTSSPSFLGIGLSNDGSWVTYDGRHILWLPPEYRPVELAISGERIAIGCESGCVLIIEVAKELIPI